jgi:hypothetical protein
MRLKIYSGIVDFLCIWNATIFTLDINCLGNIFFLAPIFFIYQKHLKIFWCGISAHLNISAGKLFKSSN